MTTRSKRSAARLRRRAARRRSQRRAPATEADDLAAEADALADPEALGVRAQVRVDVGRRRPGRQPGGEGEVRELKLRAGRLRRQPGKRAPRRPHAAELVLALEHDDVVAVGEQHLGRDEAAAAGAYDARP